MDNDEKRKLLEISKIHAQMVFETSLAIQTQIFGSLVEALIRTKALSQDDADLLLASLSNSIDDLFTDEAKRSDILAPGIASFVEGLAAIGGKSRVQGD